MCMCVHLYVWTIWNAKPYVYLCTQRSAPALVVGADPSFVRESFILEAKGLHLGQQFRGPQSLPTTGPHRHTPSTLRS